MAARVHAENPLPAAAKIQAGGAWKKLSLLREHREEMGRCTDSSFEKCGSLENWLPAIIFVTGAVVLQQAVVVGTALLELASPDTPFFGVSWRRGDVPRDGECPPRGAEPLGEGHPSPDEHCASRQDASRATGGQPSAGSPQWSYLRGRVYGPTCRCPAIRARRGALGCNEGPAGRGTDAMKMKACELAIPGSDAFWYIRTLATELVHELGELGPLSVKSSQLVWSKALHSLDQKVRWAPLYMP